MALQLHIFADLVEEFARVVVRLETSEAIHAIAAHLQQFQDLFKKVTLCS